MLTGLLYLALAIVHLHEAIRHYWPEIHTYWAAMSEWASILLLQVWAAMSGWASILLLHAHQCVLIAWDLIIKLLS